MTEDAKKVWMVMENDFGWSNQPKDFHLEYFEDIIKATKQALTIHDVVGQSEQLAVRASPYSEVQFNNKKMKIEFIYTYNEKPQEIVSYPFVLPILESKETLIEYALSDLSDEEKHQLVKISSCVYFDNKGEVDLPNWFNECNGKLYFENGIVQPF